ncbi:type II toxin-antitoxin system HipA family toxin [Myxococcota bacterium]|nr:type II toxin-antitoxin system HipA family toxin [Myxococcota bacterium]
MKKLEVRLHRGPETFQSVGVLVEEKRGIFFEYDPLFLQSGLWLSPFKLPLRAGVFQHKDFGFGPMFGLFDDSLPDGWGLLLMDRYLKGKGILPSSVSVLERLAYLGCRTMGALAYFPPTENNVSNQTVLDLHHLSNEARQIWQGNTTELLPELFRLGGSPGGARPKILVGIKEDSILSGEDDLPEGYRHWLIKFHGKTDDQESGAVERVYALMAESAGIAIPHTRLFETKEGERFFGIERFDRQANTKFHVHSFGNLIHSNFRVPSCDYGQFLEVVQILTKNYHDVVQGFRRMIFNIATYNRDDHVKNFVFRLVEGEWRLAPAFDLTFAEGPGGEHSMSVEGEGKMPRKQHVLSLAKRLSIPQIETEQMIEEVCDATQGWKKAAALIGISKKRIKQIAQKIDQSIKALRSD